MTDAFPTEAPSRKARIVLANDPRSYREAMAEVIRRTRPGLLVETTDPASLDAFIAPPGPDMVVCSEATDLVRSKVPVWVELYPDHGSHSLASIRGDLEKHEDMQLPDLLAIVDRALDPTT